MAALRWHIPFFLEQSRSTHFWDIKSSKWLWGLKAKKHLFDTAIEQEQGRTWSSLCSSWFVLLRNLNLWIPPKRVMWSTPSIYIDMYRMHLIQDKTIVLHTHTHIMDSFFVPTWLHILIQHFWLSRVCIATDADFLLTPHTVHTAASLTELVWRSNHHWL